MRKLRLESALSLCLLLLGAYAHLFAHAPQDRISSSSRDLVEESRACNPKQEDFVLITPAGSNDKKQSFKRNDAEVWEEEEDERELTWSKKRYARSSYHNTVFFVHAWNYLLACVQEIPYFDKHSTFFSPRPLHLIFKVFRI